MSGSQKSVGRIGRASCGARVEGLERRTLLSVSVGSVFAPGSPGLSTAGFDAGSSAVTDHAGNVYVAGVFTGGITLGKGLSTLFLPGGPGPGLSCFVVKYNSKGIVQWATPFVSRQGLAGPNQIGGIALDPFQGSLYVTGQTAYEMQIGFNTGQDIYQGAFVAKLSTSDGGVFWTHEILNNSAPNRTAAFAQAVAVDSTGHVFVGGSFSGTVSFDGKNAQQADTARLTANAASDAFLLELSDTGTIIGKPEQFAPANTPIDGGAVDAIRALAVDKAGNVYVTGQFQGFISFSGKSLVANGAGATDAFVAKLTNKGVVVATPQSFGGTGVGLTSIGRAITLDPSGNVWVGGDFEGTANFGGGKVTSKGGEDAFLLQESSSLKYLHSKTFGGAGNDQINAIAVNAAGVYSTGYFNSAVKLDKLPAIVSNGDDDIFVAHLSTKTFLFDSVLGMGGNGIDVGNSVALDSLGKPYLTGLYNNSVQFSSKLGFSTADPSGDFFLLQLLA